MSGNPPSFSTKRVAQPFGEVQGRVSDLLKGKILVGHAVFNDLKACAPMAGSFPLVSYGISPAGIVTVTPIPFNARHPTIRVQIQNCQEPASSTEKSYGSRIRNTNPRRRAFERSFNSLPALCCCVCTYVCPQVTDARATMAIYRLHRREWEKGKNLTSPPHVGPDRADLSRQLKKRKRPDGEEDNSAPACGKKGVSSGLSTVVRLNPSRKGGTSPPTSKKRAEWWSELGSSKGSVRIS